jgi:hypothetical protein
MKNKRCSVDQRINGQRTTEVVPSSVDWHSGEYSGQQTNMLEGSWLGKPITLSLSK